MIAPSVLVESAPTTFDLWQHAWGASLALGAFAFGAVVGIGPGRRGRRVRVSSS